MAEQLLARWGKLCEENWLSDNGEKISGESRVKYFLSGVAYYLVVGTCDGMETYYKRRQIQKWELPFSSAGEIDVVKGERCFGTSWHPGKSHKQSPAEKYQELIDSGHVKKATRAVVDTENVFTYEGMRCRISDELCPQYSPIETKEGPLYGMDYINCILMDDNEIVFYDANMDYIPDEAIEMIVPT